jgi:hypothetical protein
MLYSERLGYALLGFYGTTVARAYGTMMWSVYRRKQRIRRLHLGVPRSSARVGLTPFPYAGGKSLIQ